MNSFIVHQTESESWFGSISATTYDMYTYYGMLATNDIQCSPVNSEILGQVIMVPAEPIVYIYALYLR